MSKLINYKLSFVLANYKKLNDYAIYFQWQTYVHSQLIFDRKLHYDQQIIDVFGNYWIDSLKKN